VPGSRGGSGGRGGQRGGGGAGGGSGGGGVRLPSEEGRHWVALVGMGKQWTRARGQKVPLSRANECRSL
jgi:hypothetical protein